MPDLNSNSPMQALIAAAVILKLRPQIRASFFFAWAVPIALTGKALPWPYDQIFYIAGAVLAGSGVIVLLAVQFVGKD